MDERIKNFLIMTYHIFLAMYSEYYIFKHLEEFNLISPTRLP